ncbi:MAG: hypothetical protein K9G67_05460 [Bacteroidales bacterium]|nr:hypothetical protein [Bacteroidales bacterium]MCF8344309.1 hypothetical protein [Bacteroidales bacterium]MCF8350908.1 hypothetical protein [Bacteroidales bacterium]MCF8375782.1 hypothetical protein [Bacteroidales bacterium]MCF8401536.1 hypothetical protein [Bacteroidales bacterium]
MDDFIYILLGVAWIGYSIYSSQKKLKEKQQKARRSGEQSHGQSTEYSEESKPKSFIDRLFEEFEEKPEPSYEEIGNDFDRAKQKVNQPQREVKETKYQPATYSVEDARTMNDMVESNSGLSSDYFKNKSGSSARTKDEEWEERKKKHYQTSFYEDEQDEEEVDFDLRQAVVFSEILNRPKFMEGSVT